MSKQSMHSMLLAGLLVPLVASASNPIGPISGITVTENGIGPANDGCASFVVTQDQVRSFFKKAVLISGSQEHDNFLHGPCTAKGTLETRYDTWQWEIRNLGTATITASNGDIFVLGNPDQESTLAEDKPGR